VREREGERLFGVVPELPRAQQHDDHYTVDRASEPAIYTVHTPHMHTERHAHRYIRCWKTRRANLLARPRSGGPGEKVFRLMLREETKVNHDTAILNAHKRGRASIAREILRSDVSAPDFHLNHLYLDANALSVMSDRVDISSRSRSINKQREGRGRNTLSEYMFLKNPAVLAVNTTEIRTP